ncbi:MAG: replication-associated recombination protein A [Marinobacter sp.]|uniref:replication-associated recombination protein A n=1 Tax=Marinobacter sp. TaxID=50741 RepID=UPI0029C2E301|nr:replication-associated recombination protein A [Marinobacter sp.]MDX5335121.1 replication-associated recombination protein A [Marinobacter sp.]MDX5385885.1 replication-associated recombination protein A [Marinobacter sp.]MDX5441877.1 replication-associated recombination protein A [Alteromonadaceae bacterium]MDX5471435.1 replication-associated recombination protein A [Marinobacter sp.]
MQDNLFEPEAGFQPLAARMRPANLDEYVGQSHLVGPGKPLRRAVEQGQLHSMILWGPPGVGKTTFARLLANVGDLSYETLSAVLSGVKDIRDVVERARNRKQSQGRDTLLFVDEVHRFNKSQQDAFLPHIEDGTFIFVGATTENPSFELNSALLSRTRVYVLKNLDKPDILELLNRALVSPAGFGGTLQVPAGVLDNMAEASGGDARRALNILEVAADLAEPDDSGQNAITAQTLEQVLQTSLRRFDKGGDVFYDQISALHKSVRGSSPDGSLYWLCRMLDGGCDPLYVARRLVRIASEDIGNADPRALQITMQAWDAQERLGSPEGELALAQAVTYLALAPKSNAVYKAFNECMADIRKDPDYEVPVHLRNAPTKLMKSLGHGDEYRYAHDEPDAYAAGESYLPEAIHQRRYYQPVMRGLEIKLAEKRQRLDDLDARSGKKRY